VAFSPKFYGVLPAIKIKNPFLSPNQALLMGILAPSMIWGAFTANIVIGKQTEYICMRSFITTGALLFGLGIALESVFDSVAIYSSIGILMVFIIIAGIVHFKKFPNRTLKVSEDDPIHQAEYWKGGLNYFNKNDKRLFVPKRYQDIDPGLTPNYGQKKAWMMAVISILGMTSINLIIVIIRLFEVFSAKK
jgi:uncharacterized membrane protein